MGFDTPLRSVAGRGVGRRPHNATAPPPGGVLARGRNTSERWHQLTTLQLTSRCTGGGAAGRDAKQVICIIQVTILGNQRLL